MATPAQIAANRANAKKSTGAVTPEGKAKVSQNALTHGLRSSQFCVAPWENQAEYDTLLAEFMEAEQPVDPGETGCVLRMVQSLWSAQRAMFIQNGCFTSEPLTPAQKAAGNVAVGVQTTLERYVRYHAAHDRAYQRAHKELVGRRKEREKQEIGFVRAERAEAEETRKAEKHKATARLVHIRTQREEIRLMKDLGPMLPPNCTPQQLAELLEPAQKCATAA